MRVFVIEDAKGKVWNPRSQGDEDCRMPVFKTRTDAVSFLNDYWDMSEDATKVALGLKVRGRNLTV